MQQAMASQQACSISLQPLSPLVQVMQTPSSVLSHLQMPIAMLQQHIIMPFIIIQQLHMPPAIMVQRFCIMVALILSSHLQTIFIPPGHFSIVIVQRGTIIHCGAVGIEAPVGIPVAPIPMPGIPMPARSIIIAVVTLLYQVQDPNFGKGVLWVAVWFAVAIGYFALVGRHRLILSPEEEFALEHKQAALNAAAVKA